MSNTQPVNEPATGTSTAAAVDLKVEVVPLPVSDVDRAKRFYEGLGWRVDADVAAGDEWRVVQLTPPGSPCSVMFGKGFTTAVPGSLQGTFLVVDDLEAARAELVRHGADVSDVFHFENKLLRAATTKGRTPGRDPKTAPTSHLPHSVIRTETAGCFKKSPRGFPDADSARTLRR